MLLELGVAAHVNIRPCPLFLELQSPLLSTPALPLRAFWRGAAALLQHGGMLCARRVVLFQQDVLKVSAFPWEHMLL